MNTHQILSVNVKFAMSYAWSVICLNFKRDLVIGNPPSRPPLNKDAMEKRVLLWNFLAYWDQALKEWKSLWELYPLTPPANQAAACISRYSFNILPYPTMGPTSNDIF